MNSDSRNKLVGFLTRKVWKIDTGPLGKFKTFIVKSLRLIYVAFTEISEGQLTLRAMSLVYTTLLSIVPLLAVSFSVLKAFGIHNEVVQPLLLKFMAPLGDKGVEITAKIIGFVENMKVGVLGSLGLAMLLYTVLSVIQKIEIAFNFIWRIQKPRTLARRFSDYMSVMLVGPVLIFAAIGVTASFTSHSLVQKIISIEPFGTFFYISAKVLPYIIVCSAFTFMYIFIPNTKVQFKSALAGGIMAGVLWQATGWAFATFTVSSAKYTAIYSSFAILIVFMIWIYLNWLILLAGAQVSFYHQFPNFLSAKKEMFQLSNKLRERLAFSIMFFIGYNYYKNKPPWTIHDIVNHLGVPVDPVYDIMALLEKNSLVLETGDNPPSYLPARDLETITLQELLDCVRIADEETRTIEQQILTAPEVDSVMDGLDTAIAGSLGTKTLKDIVRTAA